MYSIVVASSPIVKPVVSADLPSIAGIYAGYVRGSTATFELEPPDLAEWTRRRAAVTDAGLPFLAAEVDGRLAGYAYCSPWKPRPAYRYTAENSIYLAPWATGRGVGGVLLDALLHSCREAGLREVIAVIADPERNPASTALHRRRGFADAGVLRNVGHKHDRWLDTLLLQKSLAG
ncbi:GNAT family N-acetyltransferase [Amycolatopsis granulosa]|uniref:GNAT family N-acetyltransferase n=1 Tax=Amycolatopsis granulosa TaxID=185684 RepID=UPI00141F5194|nr:GNAT family N-acetyltransferase [Amycolatopsis granulosa]